MGKYKELTERIDRIERKCDRILCHLSASARERESQIDVLIERMHRNARQLREQCRHDSKLRKRWKSRSS